MRWRPTAALLLAALTAAVGLVPSAAAGRHVSRPPRFSLTVSPARLVVPAGKLRSARSFTVTNGGSRPLHVDLFVSEFTQAENGRIAFVRPGALSAASWLRATPRSFDLRPGTSRIVRVTVIVPLHAEPGERQVGLIFKVPARGGAEKNIAISGAIGAELLIGVPGPISRRIGIGPLDLPTIADGGPILVRVKVTNLEVLSE